ncbi:putative ATP synthase F0, A subunit [Ancylostoma caninum]|uniref:Putative ATP synthase F0, A subunit n=1 Tax=Ancylostoma caninum TaxID=29170 RepID=A0A368H4M9_ANCCA|nr:putative ATP synthase F0, A subunit [Ancylostoma caninum]
MPENQCSVDSSTFVPEEEWMPKILTIQGSLLISVFTLIFMGATGLVGVFAKMVGPITITPLLLMLTLGVVPTLHEKMNLHWISVVVFCILIAMGIFLENVRLPLPYYSVANRSWKVAKPRVFGQFPYLIAILAAWFICFLLTVTGLEPEGGEARTDKNHTMTVLTQSPWFQVPYPGQFGFPKASLGLTLGFVASCVACIMESIGDYQTCARVSHQRHPPSSSVNRAIIFEGIGSALAAVMGLGTGVTTYAENIALMHITRVVSRSTMQVAGLLLILAGLFTKCAAVLASIPDAVVGGVLAMGLAMITGVAISNLQKVDLRLSRNLTIMGTAILLGTLIPYHFEKNRVNTGVKSLDDCLNMLLGIRMLIGGVTAFILDNTVPGKSSKTAVKRCKILRPSGATREQRGFALKVEDDNICAEDDGYAPSPLVRRFLLRYPQLCKLPFLPSQRSLLVLATSSTSTSMA